MRFHRGVPLDVRTEGVLVTLIDFTLSRLQTVDGDTAFSDLEADPDLFKGPRGDCQVGPLTSSKFEPCVRMPHDAHKEGRVVWAESATSPMIKEGLSCPPE